METFYVKNMKDVRKSKKEIERELGVEIEMMKNGVQVSGDAVKEYDAERVFEAINFGFTVKKALLLKQDDYVFRTVHIKDHTKRNLKDVKARLIGTKGKTRRTIAEISDCEVLIGEGDVGVIGHAEDIEDTVTAIINLIKGSKQANMYRFLEKQNRLKKEDFFFDESIKK
jgi:KH domain-containing protein